MNEMNNLKRYVKEIIIALLLVFGMSKCTQSCNRQIYLDKANVEIDSLRALNASNVRDLVDSMNALNMKIKVYEQKIEGLNNALSIQDEANKRITEAKKNISVTVKSDKNGIE